MLSRTQGPRDAAEVALVTGAAGGIGGACVRALVDAGWVVAANHLPSETVEGFGVPGDVAVLGDVERMVDRAEAALGPIGCLVNCAGHDEEVPLADVSPERWRRMLRVHLGGTYNTCRVLAPRMRSSASGVILNVASELALSGSSSHPHYVAAKGAVLGLSRALARELAPDVRVNVVAPGPTDTALLPDAYRDEAYLATLPTRRLSTPAQIGALVAFLASDTAMFFTGQVISPNSGAVI